MCSYFNEINNSHISINLRLFEWIYRTSPAIAWCQLYMFVIDMSHFFIECAQVHCSYTTKLYYFNRIELASEAYRMNTKNKRCSIVIISNKWLAAFIAIEWYFMCFFSSCKCCPTLDLFFYFIAFEYRVQLRFKKTHKHCSQMGEIHTGCALFIFIANSKSAIGYEL